jgi:hypothetical protein
MKRSQKQQVYRNIKSYRIRRELGYRFMSHHPLCSLLLLFLMNIITFLQILLCVSNEGNWLPLATNVTVACYALCTHTLTISYLPMLHRSPQNIEPRTQNCWSRQGKYLKSKNQMCKSSSHNSKFSIEKPNQGNEIFLHAVENYISAWFRIFLLNQYVWEHLHDI